MVGAVEVAHVPAAGVPEARTALERDADEAATSRAELRGKTEFWYGMSSRIGAIC